MTQQTTPACHWYDGKNENWIISYANGEFKTAFALLHDEKDYQKYANILPLIFNDCVSKLKQSGYLPFSANNVSEFLLNFISLTNMNDINANLDGRKTVQTLLTVMVDERDDVDSVVFILMLLENLLLSKIDNQSVVNVELKHHLQAVVDIHFLVDLMRQHKIRKYPADIDGDLIINSSDDRTNKMTIRFLFLIIQVFYVLLYDRTQPEDQRIRTTLLYSGIIPLMGDLTKTWSDEKELVGSLGKLSRRIMIKKPFKQYQKAATLFRARVLRELHCFPRQASTISFVQSRIKAETKCQCFFLNN